MIYHPNHNGGISSCTSIKGFLSLEDYFANFDASRWLDVISFMFCLCCFFFAFCFALLCNADLDNIKLSTF